MTFVRVKVAEPRELAVRLRRIRIISNQHFHHLAIILEELLIVRRQHGGSKDVIAIGEMVVRQAGIHVEAAAVREDGPPLVRVMEIIRVQPFFRRIGVPVRQNVFQLGQIMISPFRIAKLIADQDT
ncbi:hypothetical protein D3C74_291870 [compost metagenome]